MISEFDGTLAYCYDWYAGVINGMVGRYGFRHVEAEDTEWFR